MTVEDSYDGPRLEEDMSNLSSEWCIKLKDFLKNQKKLHKRYVSQLACAMREYFETQKSLIDITIPDDQEFSVCGDVHGQFYDLLNIFEINGDPAEDNPYLFNGDFVDRGSFSVEVMILFTAWKVCLPNHFHMSRGNHESKNMNKLYG